MKFTKSISLFLAAAVMFTSIFAVSVSASSADTASSLEKTVLANAEKRKTAILSSKTNVSVKGTKYYVSNSGNDNNDGLSPLCGFSRLCLVGVIL